MKLIKMLSIAALLGSVALSGQALQEKGAATTGFEPASVTAPNSGSKVRPAPHNNGVHRSASDRAGTGMGGNHQLKKGESHPLLAAPAEARKVPTKIKPEQH